MPIYSLMLSDDLLFTSRVSATARAYGLSVVTARSTELLLKKASEQFPETVLIDLQNPGLKLGEFLAALRTMGTPKLLAYGAHVDKAALEAARQAECDLVMPRSRFISNLEEKLAEWLDATGKTFPDSPDPSAQND